VLDEVEIIETDKKDRPLKDIIIEDCKVFFDPYEQADEQHRKERSEEIQQAKAEKEKLEKERQLKLEAESAPKVFKSGVGKYINLSPNTAKLNTLISGRLKRSTDDELSETEKKKAKFVPGKLGDFSSW
jgi:hypothetical protein